MKSFIAHEKYSNRFNDIGLVRLEQEANFQQRNIKPICLPFKREYQDIPEKLIIIGWGKTDQNTTKSAIIQKAILPLYNKDKCLKKFQGSLFIEGQFCAGGEG